VLLVELVELGLDDHAAVAGVGIVAEVILVVALGFLELL
jgi:hypothetical protein